MHFLGLFGHEGFHFANHGAEVVRDYRTFTIWVRRCGFAAVCDGRVGGGNSIARFLISKGSLVMAGNSLSFSVENIKCGRPR